ncbi:MAG: diguanylate cyclase [Spirochaetia bacterium]|nr:diguanylate cyclase [Spirochaetia bacterium]
MKTSLANRVLKTDELISHTYTVITKTNLQERIITDIRIALQEYLLTKNTSHLKEIDNHILAFEQQLESLTLLAQDNLEQQQRLKEVRTTFNKLIEEAVQPLMHEELEDTVVLSLLEVYKTRSQELEASLNSIEKNIYALLVFHQETLNYWFGIDRILTILIPILIFLILLFFSIQVIVHLKRYRRQQEQDQRNIAETRDRYLSVINSSNLGTWEWDISQDSITVNDTWAELLGYTKEELEPVSLSTFKNLIEPENFDRVMHLLNEHFCGKSKFFLCDFRMKHKDGHWVWILGRGQVLRYDQNHKPLLMSGTHSDISERVAQQQALLRSEEESRRLFEAMTQGFAYCQILTDENGIPNDYRILRVNDNFEIQTGLKNKQSIGKRITELIDTVEPYWFEYNGKVALTGEPRTFEAYNKGLDRLFRISSFSPEYGYFAMIIDDITQQKKNEALLLYEKTLFETTLMSVGDGVISTEANGNVQFMNKVAETLTGWQFSEAKELHSSEVFKTLYGDERHQCPDPVQLALEEKKTITLDEDTILIARDGFERFISVSAAPILDTKQQVSGVVLVFRDSTDQRKKQSEMLNLSITDALTTLPNRRFYDKAKQKLDDEPYYPLSLVLADVNGLKLTNDAFGHKTGDELLCKVSEVLRKTCRESDIVSRIGGDEFILLLPQTDALHAQTIVKRINAALKKEEIKGIHVSVSFGIAVKHEKDEPYEETFKIAEDAMYQDKLTLSQDFKKRVICSLQQRLYSYDQSLKEHSEMVGNLCALFAKELGFSAERVEEMRLAGIYHDLGKIALNPAVYTKNFETLTQSEKAEFKRHSEIGYNILRSVGSYAVFAEAVLYHHEKWDGSGYPQGLKGEAIPLEAQILSLCNFYADLIGPSLIRTKITEEEAITLLLDRKNLFYKSEMVTIFIDKVLKNA